ncbi:ADP-dependent glucokinase-like [Saccoglossus kowalevskii]|uniref:ADP-dependent glucokinase-like n=1 Tax=Saccoglossus kowalevskii TaxID=10224 RepID=A0ABM0GKR4_SACKO|nr:PREDICTED: ADP-dependent glucokinase-like [Saccoglossus kowalevskii]
MASTVKLGSVVTIIIVFAAYVYKRNLDEQLRDHLLAISNSLLRAEQNYAVTPKVKVAVGFGACEDVFVDSLELLHTMSLQPPVKEIHHDYINSSSELAEVFAFFFKHGAAAERFMSDENFFAKLVDVAKDLPDSRGALGGNAPVIANRLAIEGCEVLLGGTLSKRYMKELNDGVQVAGDVFSEDDVHLIMEYKAGETWGKYSTPRANRFIVHSDESNPLLSSLEAFQTKLPGFNPQLLIVSGLQMMDNFPSAQRKERIASLKKMLQNVPKTTKIHFELASFSEEEMVGHLVESVIPYSDSIGMNEQELANLYSLLMYGNITLVSDAYPRIATVLDHLRSIYNILHSITTENGQRPITRIHTHTLAYQVIITTRNQGWKNTMAAAAKASLTAFRHVSGSSEIDTNKAKLIMDDSFSISREEGSKRMPLNADRPVSCWQEYDYDICLAPVLVATQVRQTAGAGDNISSAGLAVQI